MKVSSTHNNLIIFKIEIKSPEIEEWFNLKHFHILSVSLITSSIVLTIEKVLKSRINTTIIREVHIIFTVTQIYVIFLNEQKTEQSDDIQNYLS